MRKTTGIRKSPSEKIVKDIKRATRKHYSSEKSDLFGQPWMLTEAGKLRPISPHAEICN
ncbi:hypothetical protein [Parasedimentitalea denitrificans]|uniref:hypothetical protein n=1 Tax=Parasedimentitalea denitrificans TaxID=2211118 RepID=UPI00142FF786|nr:hypothetical protein [Sedimentitalea sp. CY04]